MLANLLNSLLDSNGFCQVSGLVYVAASADGYVVGEQFTSTLRKRREGWGTRAFWVGAE
jgi:hypothetical protein